jgi:predicted enzyme related to lactoylglutathione lyase
MAGMTDMNQEETVMEVGVGRCGAIVVLRVDNVDQTRATLMLQGVEFEGTIQEIPGEVRIATFRDPAGNRLQLCEVLSRNKAKPIRRMNQRREAVSLLRSLERCES